MQVTINYWEKGDRFYINTEDRQSIGWFQTSRDSYNSKTGNYEKVSDWKLGGNIQAVSSVIEQVNARAKEAQINLSGDCLPSFFAQTWNRMIIGNKKQKASHANLNRVFTVEA